MKNNDSEARQVHVACFCRVPAISRSGYKSVPILNHEPFALRVFTMALESP